MKKSNFLPLKTNEENKVIKIDLTKNFHNPEKSPKKCEKNCEFPELMKWFVLNSGSAGKLVIKHEKKSDREVYALEDIKEGEILVRVPESLFLSPDNSHVREFCLEYNQEEDFQCLVSYVMKFKFNNSTYFYPYLNYLPHDGFQNFPHFYNDTDLQRLEGTVLALDLKNLLELKNEEFKSLLTKSIREFEEYCFEDYLKADALVSSRTFSLPNKKLVLAPIADLFSHSFSNNANWRFNPLKQALEIFAVRDIKKGDLVTISYGKKSNSDFLLYYGFTVEGNKNGKIEVPVESFIDQDLLLAIDKAAIDREKFNLNIDYLGSKIFTVLPLYRRALKAIPSQGNEHPSLFLVNKEREILVISKLRVILHKVFAKHKTSLESDFEKMKSVKTNSTNELNTLRVRVEEKKMITHTLSLLKFFKDMLLNVQPHMEFTLNEESSQIIRSSKILLKYLEEVNNLLGIKILLN